MHISLDEKKDQGTNTVGKGERNYVVMDNFLTASATSFEKFTAEVNKIIQTIPSLKDRLVVTTLHPEHIESEKRSPLPICVCQWNDNE